MPELLKYAESSMAGLTRAATVPTIPAPQVAVGGAQVTVLLDGEEIRSRVVTPKAVAAANVEGQRRRDFLNTGRTATASA